MGFIATTRGGGDEREPTVERLREILGQLDVEDEEHPAVWLTHESEWYLAAYPGGLLVWENAETADDPRHMNGVARNVDNWACLTAVLTLNEQENYCRLVGAAF